VQGHLNSIIYTYRVGQKSKLLILNEYINKTEKDEREQIRTATEKMKHCLIFSRERFYFTTELYV